MSSNAYSITEEMSGLTMIPVDKIADGPHIRAKYLDLDHAARLGECIDDLPAITVRKRSDRYELIDGAHRLAAHRDAGRATIAAIVTVLDDADAYRKAVEANNAHGLPLTTPDRKRAAQRLIELDPDASDRSIAAVVGLSNKTVTALRPRPREENPHLDTPRITPPSERTPVPPITPRLGGDGKVYPPSKPAADAQRARVGEKLAAQPDASDRAIAKEAGVSPSTVGKVRKGLVGLEGGKGAPAEPTVADLVTVIPRSFANESSFRRSNASSALGKLLDHHRVRDVDRLLDLTKACPAEYRQAAHDVAAINADAWARVARALNSPNHLEST